MDMTTALTTLLQTIADDYRQWSAPSGDERMDTIRREMTETFVAGLRIEEGRVYTKIIAGTSVWGFVNKTNPRFKPGDILMAAGYNKPALNQARGNILDGGYQIRWTGPHYLR